MTSIKDFFDRVYVVSMSARQDRWDTLTEHLAGIEWPFAEPVRFRAVDARVCKPPTWWKTPQPISWGCWQSHVQILQDAMMDGLKSFLVLEDDVVFSDDFSKRVEPAMLAVPDDWDQLYLGGQLLQMQAHKPQRVNDHVIVPWNVNRTHAYGLRQKFYERCYEALVDYPSIVKLPYMHIDHWYGAMHQTGRSKVYAIWPWLAGQRAGLSDISSIKNPDMFWLK
jgi:GR25 family glycosyltransferase involved in LPS biosynthesis